MKRLLVFAGLLLWATSSWAYPITTFLLAFNGPFVNGIPTYPYTLRFAGSPSFQAMCDDYYHDGTPGDYWLANLTNLGTGNLSNLRFASSGLVSYEEAAWILLQTYTTPTSQWPDMNFAVWHIFNSTVVIDSNAQNWIDLAMANYQYEDYDHVYVVTPVQIDAPPTGDQEFLFVWRSTDPPPSPTAPEPANLILLGTGALGLSAALRRKFSH